MVVLWQAHLLLKYEAASLSLFLNVDLHRFAELCELVEVRAHRPLPACA